MKIQKLMTTLCVAVTTMAMTLALVGPERVEAVDQDATAVTQIQPVIQQPTLALAGLQVQLTMDKSEYAPGDEPIVTLEATNPTDEPVATKVWVGMTSSGVDAMLSRAPSLPQYNWSESRSLALEPGESVTLRLATGERLVAGNTVSVTMSDTDQKAAMAKLLNVKGRSLIRRGTAAEINTAETAGTAMARRR